MKIPSSRGTGSTTIDMTPMIDVVFQLIIFFLVSGHLIKQETQVKLPLPTATSGNKVVAENQARLTVNVLPDGELLLGGRTHTADELTARFVEKLRELGQDLEVRIRSDRTVPYARVEPVMLSCAKAGIWNVTFAVYRPEEASP